MASLETTLMIRWLCSLAASGKAKTAADREVAVLHAKAIAHVVSGQTA